MLQRHANLLGGLILSFDVLCLALAWTAARLVDVNVDKAAFPIHGWSLLPLGLLWLFSAWLFRFHRSLVLSGGRQALRDLLIKRIAHRIMR